RQGLIHSLGSFIGQCIIKNYGGHWQVDQETQAICIEFDDKNKIFPFAKTAKQFENGPEDSVYSFYTIIPTLFKITISKETAENETAQKINSSAGPKKWWKFW